VIVSEREKDAMKLVDPASLPFDPAEPEYDEDSAGSEEERAEPQSFFASGIAALRDRIKRR
jgi:hypothetical protein